jgi:predicted O-methyltransferase YrrM
MARYTTDAEVNLLCRYSSISKKGIVEIGVLDGETTLSLSKHTNCPIYGIDPIISDSMDQNLIGSSESILSNMRDYKDFVFYQDYSFNVVKTFKSEFDFIFIDGDHKYEAVKKDFIDWFTLLDDGGYIAFHDSGPVTSINADFKGWEGCIKLVEEIKEGIHFNGKMEWVENVDTINVFRKIGK